MTDADALKRFWELANELTSRHDANNDLTADIYKQVADLKQRAAGKTHDQDDHTLLLAVDAPNVDGANAALGAQYNTLLQKYQRTISRNQQLERDCSELQGLVQEYESNLSKVADKLRMHTVSATEGQIRLRKEYEALLDAEKGTTAELMIENMTLRQHLHQIASMLRAAYESPEGDEHAAQLAQLAIENQGLREMLQISQATATADDIQAPLSIKQEQPQNEYSTFFY